MNRQTITFVLLAVGVYLAIRFFHRQNRQDSEIRAVEAEVREHQREMNAANDASFGAMPPISTLGELPLVGAILNPFLNGGQMNEAQILPSFGFGTNDVPAIPVPQYSLN